MTPEPTRVVTCPRCRAVNTHGSSQCFLCDRSLVGLHADHSTWSPASSAPAPVMSFHLGTMMLVIALIAVGLGVAITQPALAVVLTLPAIIATCRLVTLRNRVPDGNPSSLRYVGSFLATFTVVCLVMIASGFAFFMTCLGVISQSPGAYGGEFFGTGLLCGAIAGVAVAIGITVAIVRSRRRRFQAGPRSGRGY